MCIRDRTYSLLLSMLPLTPTHKAHLLSPRRGLTEEQIARFGFKSTPPAFLCRSYAERLRRHGCTLQGVPGFYQDDAGRWTINFGSRTAGILLPAVGMDGLICGMQIRLDTPLRRRDDPPVSYTHLDVYKRQILISTTGSVPGRPTLSLYRGFSRSYSQS